MKMVKLKDLKMVRETPILRAIRMMNWKDFVIKMDLQMGLKIQIQIRLRLDSPMDLKTLKH